MGTPYQPVKIPFKGTNLDQDPRIGEPRLTSVFNSRWTKDGRLERRPAFWNFHRNNYDTAPTPPTLTPFTGGDWLASRGDEPLVGSSTRLYSLAKTAGGGTGIFYDRGILSPTRARFLMAGVQRTDGWFPDVTAASDGTVTIMAANASSTTDVTVYLHRDGEILDSTNLVSDNEVRCIFLNSLPAVVYQDAATANLKITQWSDTGFHTPITTTLAADFAGGFNNLDCYVNPTDGNMYLAYRNTTANTVKVLKVTPGLVVTSTTFTTATIPNSMGITALSTKVVVGVGFGTSLTTRVFNTSLVDQAVTMTIVAPAVDSAVRCGLQMDATAANCWITYTDNGGFTSSHIRKRSTTAATDSLIRAYMPQAVSAPWLRNGRIYELFAPYHSGPPNFSLYNGIVADITDAGSYNHVCVRIPAIYANPVMGHVYNDTLAISKFVTFNENGGIEQQAQAYRLDYPRPAYTTHGRVTYFSGSCPSYYDGIQVAEQGFHVPATVTAVGTTGVGTVPVGSYTFQSVYRWVNSAGEIERSQPSIPRTYAAAGATNVVVTVKNLEVTQKSGVSIEIYRTTVNPSADAPLYLEGTVVNDPQVQTQTYTVSLTDATLVTREILYTVGGVLEAEPVTANGGVVSQAGRLWFLDDEKIWASSQNSFPGAPAFSSFSAIQCSTALGYAASLSAASDRIIAFFANGAVATGGPGFDQLGHGPGYYSPTTFFHGDGPTSPQGSKQVSGIGVVFETSGKIYSTDGGTTVEIGQGIRHDLIPGNEYTIGVLQDSDELIVCGPEDDTVCYVMSHRFGEWSRWGLGDIDQNSHIGAIRCGEFTYILTANTGTDNLWQETTGATDLSSTSVSLPFTQQLNTSWVRPDGSGTGWNRARALTVVGEKPSPAGNDVGVDILAFYDDNDETASAAQSVEISGAGAPVTWPSRAFRPEFRLSRQKCNAVRFVINIQPTAGNEIANFPLSFAEVQVTPVSRTAPSRYRGV